MTPTSRLFQDLLNSEEVLDLLDYITVYRLKGWLECVENDSGWCPEDAEFNAEMEEHLRAVIEYGSDPSWT